RHPVTAKIDPIGLVQDRLIIALLRRLRPRVVQTSNHYYQRLLASRGIEASVLPLFGNIPVTAEPASEWLDEAIRSNGGADISMDRGYHWLCGIFGGIAPDWSAMSLLTRLCAPARGSARRMTIISAGRSGLATVSRFAEWRRHLPDLNVIPIGPR